MHVKHWMQCLAQRGLQLIFRAGKLEALHDYDHGCDCLNPLTVFSPFLDLSPGFSNPKDLGGFDFSGECPRTGSPVHSAAPVEDLMIPQKVGP